MRIVSAVRGRVPLEDCFKVGDAALRHDVSQGTGRIVPRVERDMQINISAIVLRHSEVTRLDRLRVHCPPKEFSFQTNARFVSGSSL